MLSSKIIMLNGVVFMIYISANLVTLKQRRVATFFILWFTFTPRKEDIQSKVYYGMCIFIWIVTQ